MHGALVLYIDPLVLELAQKVVKSLDTLQGRVRPYSPVAFV